MFLSLRARNATRKLGIKGENAAVKYLEDCGMIILARNFRCKAGELDIVALDGDEMVFVEVKTRRDDAFAEAREFVDTRKCERIRATASLWLASNETEKQPRFDVIEVYAPDGTATRRPLIRHWEDVF